MSDVVKNDQLSTFVNSFLSVSIPKGCAIFVLTVYSLLENCLFVIFQPKFLSLGLSMGIFTPIFFIMMASSLLQLMGGLFEAIFSLSHLSVNMESLEVALDAVIIVILLWLTSQHNGPLEVELFDLAMLLSEAHFDFKVELADEQRTVTLKFDLSFSASFVMPVALDLARGRILQESSLCSCSNLYELFWSCNLRNSLRF